MTRTRTVLIQRRDELQARARAFNAKCANVTAGTALAAECEREQKQLEDERGRYIKLATDFNGRLRVLLQLSQPVGGLSELKGEVSVITPDGRTLSGADLSMHKVTMGDRIRTGADSFVKAQLLDGSKFSVGPGSDLVVDEFVYDPDKGTRKMLATCTRGVFRFITGKISAKSPAEMVVRISGVMGGIRGTDFEALARPDGSGQVKLFSGQLEMTGRQKEAKILLEPSQMITFDAAGNLSAPTPLQ